MTMKNKTIGFIGGGRITRILLVAFKHAGVTFKQVQVFDPDEGALANLTSGIPDIITSSDDLKEAAAADVVVLSVHPPVMMETLANIKNVLRHEAVLISLAPKITIGKMSEVLGGFPNIARVNPSASSIINKGLNPVCFSTLMAPALKEEVIALLNPLGSLPEVSEPKIEAYAMISAMGHTYFWPQLQELKILAVEFGLDDNEANRVISDMLVGTADTLFLSGMPFDEVMDLVPVKPLNEVAETITGYYRSYLPPLFQKIKPA